MPRLGQASSQGFDRTKRNQALLRHEIPDEEPNRIRFWRIAEYESLGNASGFLNNLTIERIRSTVYRLPVLRSPVNVQAEPVWAFDENTARRCARS